MSERQAECDEIVKWIRARVEGLKARNDNAVSALPAHEREAAELIYAMGRKSMAMIADAIESGAHRA